MLSKNALFILGIVAGGPINPYAIVKMVNLKQPETRARIPVPSIYGIINILYKNRYISGKKVDNGNMPQMTVYSITPKGKEFLRTTLTGYLANPEESMEELALSSVMLGYLDREEVLKALDEYRSRTRSEIDARKKMIAEDQALGTAYYGIISNNHILNILKVNLKTAEELYREVQKDTEWKHGPIPFWRERVEHKRGAARSKEKNSG